MTDTTERNGLEVTEYVSVAGSVAGTVVAVFSQQLIYAAAPLTLALSLSLINRRRFEQTFQQNMTAVLSEMGTRVRQVDREISEEMQALKGSVQNLSLSPKPVNLNPIQEELSQMGQRFDTLELAITSLISSASGENFALPIDQLKQIAQLPASFNPNYLEQQIQQLQENVSSLTEAFNHREDLIRIEEIRQIAAEVQQQLSAFAPPPAPFDPSYLEQQIQQVQTNVSLVSETFNQRLEEVRKITSEFQYHLSALPPATPRFDPSYLEREIEELKGSLTQVEQVTRSNLTQLEQQNLGVAGSMGSMGWKSSEAQELTQIGSEVKQQISAIGDRFDPSYLEEEIQQLRKELQFLHEVLQSLRNPSETVDRVAIDSVYTKLNAPIANPGEFWRSKLQRLVECAAHMFKVQSQTAVQSQGVRSQQVSEDDPQTGIHSKVENLSGQSQPTTYNYTLEQETVSPSGIESAQKKVDAVLTNVTESLVAGVFQLFDSRQRQQPEVETVVPVRDRTTQLLLEEQQIEVTSMSIEVTSDRETEFSSNSEYQQTAQLLAEQQIEVNPMLLDIAFSQYTELSSNSEYQETTQSLPEQPIEVTPMLLEVASDQETELDNSTENKQTTQLVVEKQIEVNLMPIEVTSDQETELKSNQNQ
ncbi:hypothetical protein [Argonema galeatum]|uniref:hypothetical protein n=1 Tax=Argonema galeatum TaxID=2942762 RepID=UPI002013A67A|nr:hypothetical protein [Argonema galeatum]MCL1465840.1 hypothetical protein [Argonema galeatum A003/A1]